MPVSHLPHSSLFPLLPSQITQYLKRHTYFNGQQRRASPFPGGVPTTFRVPLSPLSYHRHELPPLVEDGVHCLLRPHDANDALFAINYITCVRRPPKPLIFTTFCSFFSLAYRLAFVKYVIEYSVTKSREIFLFERGIEHAP